MKKIVPMAALSLLSYLANPVVMDAAEQKKKIVENRIYSSNPAYSATGEGVVLKDFVYDISLNPNSRITLDKVFGLYAKKGDIAYNVVDARKGLQNVIAFLEKDLNSRDAQSKKERIATINHYKNLLGKISESDSVSLNGLEKAVSDGVLDVKGDSLVLPEGWKIKDGIYVLIAKSKSLDSGKEKYVANSIPIVVNLKTYSEKAEKDKSEIKEKVSEVKKPAEKVISECVTEQKTPKPKKSGKAKTRFGLESAIGTSKEGVLGAFVDVPLASGFGLEFYGNYYVKKGELISLDETTEIIEREKELIGPGTYKQRTDEITTSIMEKPITEIGIRPMIHSGKAEFYLGGGVVLSSQEKTLYGKSTIIHERNMEPLQEPQIIENFKNEGKISRFAPSLSAGAFFNLHKNLAVGASLHRIGNKNSARANLRLKF